MTFSHANKCYLKLILASLALIAGLVGASTGCTGFDQWAPQTQQPPAETPQTPAAPTTITTEDRAILAVYEHLLGQAESYQAKAYLADFYAVCDNWKAESELLKDGTSLWYVTVDMTRAAAWEGRPYWQQASWLVYNCLLYTSDAADE